MKYLLSIAILLFGCLLIVAQLPAGDFRNTRWGLTKNRIWSAERKATFVSEETPNADSRILHYRGKLEGHDADIDYYLYKGRLVRGEYTVRNPSRAIHDIYLPLLKKLKKEYKQFRYQRGDTWENLSTKIILSYLGSEIKLVFINKQFMETDLLGEGDFREASWGMSKDQVKAREIKAVLNQDNPPNSVGISGLCYNGEIEDEPVKIYYYFGKGEMVSGHYHFRTELKPAGSTYQKIKKMLVKRFGVQKKEEEQRSTRDSKRTGIYAIWYSPSSQITLKSSNERVILSYLPLASMRPSSKSSVRKQKTHPAGKTNLMYAAQNGDITDVNNLITEGTGTNDKSASGYTALMYAVESDHFEITKALVDNGADVNATDNDGFSVLMKAMYKDRPQQKKIVQLLLKSGADVKTRTNEGKTALIMAVSRGCTDIAELLLEKGADVNGKDARGFSVLMNSISAARSGSLETVELLLANGADVNSKSESSEGVSGLTALVWAVESGNVELVKLLLDKGADVNVRFGRGEGSHNLLFVAASIGTPEMIKTLIKYGADVNTKTRNGTTALTLAKKSHNEKAIKLLKELGVKD